MPLHNANLSVGAACVQKKIYVYVSDRNLLTWLWLI